MYDPINDRCYCGERIVDHAADISQIHERKIRCCLLQSEIDVFQKHDSVRGMLRA